MSDNNKIHFLDSHQIKQFIFQANEVGNYPVVFQKLLRSFQ
jgi:hypothetical protein